MVHARRTNASRRHPLEHHPSPEHQKARRLSRLVGRSRRQSPAGDIV